MDTNDRMNRKGFSRRKFLALASIGAASAAVNSKIAFASDQGTVEGYAILKHGEISEDISTLVVSDGWNDGARYLSFYYTRFTDTYGVYFSR